MATETPTRTIRCDGAPGTEGDLPSRLAGEMIRRWHAGERPCAEEFLRRHPELADQPESAIRLIYEEICLREELGEPVSAEAVLRRFPEWRAKLRVLLDCHRLLDAPAAANLPQAQGALGDYTLLAELGRGVHGRVYLASQPALGNRLVALKVTPPTAQEHLALARLQHTHIMPLFGAHHDAERNLRVLCMPYFGGAALNRVLDEMRAVAPKARTGRGLLEALDRAAARSLAAPAPAANQESRNLDDFGSLPVNGSARQFIAAASYVESICRIGACLADALHYAHERGLIHLDIKPSNVLLAADGQPMLLDFHIAQKPIRPGGPLPEWLGGTPGYTSPEQKAAMTALKAGAPIPATVDERSDLYSLGLLLDEALGGTPPSDNPEANRPLRDRNPQVSTGLADIVGKCRAPNPADRYATAAAVADDLRRHLSALPLRGVRNRSWRERWHKWRRRRPFGLALAAMAAAVLAAAISLGIVAVDRAGNQRAAAALALQEGQQLYGSRSYDRAVDALSRGLVAARRLPGGGGQLAADLESQYHQARRAWLADQLHTLADRLRYLDGASSLPRGEGQALARRWREVWQKRTLLKEAGGAKLDPELEKRLDTDLLDLGIFGADLRIRIAGPGELDQARHEALQILTETETMFGSSPVLTLQRRAYQRALGLAEPSTPADTRATPRTAWEHCAVGRALLNAGELDRAEAEFDQAIDLQPQGFWPHFYRGICAYRQLRFEEAATAFRVCIALAPESAECYFNRALAQTALGRTDRALADYDRALKLNPDLVAALLNRGLLHLEQKHFSQARADLRQALDRGSDPAPIYYNLALIDVEQHDRAAALANVQRALRANTGHKGARALLDRLER